MGMDPISLAVVGGLASGLVGGLLGGSQKQADIPAPPKPEAPPQASASPDVQGVRAGQAGQGQAGGAPGVAQTFLTGAGGVDPSQLKLDKTTLLGG